MGRRSRSAVPATVSCRDTKQISLSLCPVNYLSPPSPPASRERAHLQGSRGQTGASVRSIWQGMVSGLAVPHCGLRILAPRSKGPAFTRGGGWGWGGWLCSWGLRLPLRKLRSSRRPGGHVHSGEQRPHSHAPAPMTQPRTPCAPRPFTGIPTPAGMSKASPMGMFLGASARPQPTVLGQRTLRPPKPSRLA